MSGGKAATSRLFFKELRFRQLEALVELTRHKNFSEAAKSLGLSTVSAWRQIRALEEQFETQLVTSKGPRTRLTEDGEMLAEMARPLVENFRSLPGVFADRKEKQVRELIVAAPAGLLSDLLPEPVTRYRERFPNVNLRMVDLPSRGACNAVLKGEADLAIAGSPDLGAESGGFTAHSLARYPIRLLCPSDHALAESKRPTIRQIARHPLVLSGEGTSDRALVDAAFAKAGLIDALDVTITASRLELIVRYVEMGFGVALLASGPMVLPNSPTLRWLDVSRLFGFEEVAVFQPEGRFELPHVRAFRKLVAEAMATST